MHTKITYHFHFRSLPPDNIPTFNILPVQPPGQGLKEPHDGLGRERPRPRERLQHVRPWQAAAEGEHVLEGLARGQRAGKVAAVERAGVAGDLAEALSELELQDGAGEVPGIVQGEKLDFEMLQVKYKGVYYVQRLETKSGSTVHRQMVRF